MSWDDFLAGRTHNDFEPVACRRYPEVAKVLAWAAQFGRPQMSGSGASVFVAFASPVEAERARATVPPAWRAFVARGLNRSPLYAAAMA